MAQRRADRRHYGKSQRAFRQREHPSRRDCNTGGNFPGVMERRGVLHDKAAFRNGCFADSRAGAHLRYVL